MTDLCIKGDFLKVPLTIQNLSCCEGQTVALLRFIDRPILIAEPDKKQ